MTNKVTPDWEKANSNNLPKLDIFTVTNFLKNDDRFNAPETTGVKANTYFCKKSIESTLRKYPKLTF